jgi:hypothetical protein
MADKAAPSEEVDESGGKKAKLDASTTISESIDYGDEPPRILMGLNDAPVQFPEGTLWKGDEAVRHEASTVGAAEVREILSAVRKRLDVSYDAMWKTQEKQIPLWSSDPDEERWAQKFSERYALITYGGPGQAYFNDGGWDPFIFSRAQARSRKVTLYEYDSVDDKGKYTTQRKGTTQVAGWQDPENVVATQGRPPNQSFLGEWEPAAPAKREDAAISIIGACQQTTTFGAIAHGFTIEDDLQYAGYAASEHSGALPIFTGAKIPGFVLPEAAGKFYTNGSALLGDEKIESLSEMRKFLAPSFACDPGKVPVPMAPGTILTYNPHAFMDTVEAMVYDIEYNESGPAMKVRAEICRAIQGDPTANHPYKPPHRTAAPDSIQTHRARVKTWSDGMNAPFLPMKKKNEPDADYAIRKAAWKKDIADKTKKYSDQEWPVQRTVKLPKSVQDPGSHICFVLRVSADEKPENKRVQLFDTSSNTAYWVMERQARRGLITRPLNGGIMDGCGFPKAGDGQRQAIPSNSPIVGVGVTPKPNPQRLSDALEALENARPIGLVRFALTVRKPPAAPKPPSPWAKPSKAKAPQGADLGPELFPNQYTFGGGVQKGEIVYISRLLRMYGDAATQNFYLTRLLWSLRGTPYFSNLQPWWFVFIPVGLFAKSMWASDGRSMRPRDFVSTVLKLPRYFDKKTDPKAMPDPWVHRTDLKLNTHYRLTNVFTSTGGDVPDRTGKAFVWCRLKSALSDGGDSSLKADGYSPPKEMIKIMETLGVDADYQDPKGEVIVPPPDAGGRAGSDPLDYFRYG